jgi:hypothetical protein
MIGIHWSDVSVKTKHYVSGYLDLLQAVANLLLLWSASSWCYAGLMMCSIHIDESATRVDCCMVITSYVYLFLKSWTIYLIIWVTGARCTVIEATHLSGFMGVKSMPIVVATRCFMGYKYPIRLTLITISRPIFLASLGFSSLTLY